MKGTLLIKEKRRNSSNTNPFSTIIIEEEYIIENDIQNNKILLEYIDSISKTNYIKTLELGKHQQCFESGILIMRKIYSKSLIKYSNKIIKKYFSILIICLLLFDVVNITQDQLMDLIRIQLMILKSKVLISNLLQNKLIKIIVNKIKSKIVSNISNIKDYNEFEFVFNQILLIELLRKIVSLDECERKHSFTYLKSQKFIFTVYISIFNILPIFPDFEYKGKISRISKKAFIMIDNYQILSLRCCFLDPLIINYELVISKLLLDILKNNMPRINFIIPNSFNYNIIDEMKGTLGNFNCSLILIKILKRGILPKKLNIGNLISKLLNLNLKYFLSEDLNGKSTIIKSFLFAKV